MNSLIQDIRYGARSLIKRPGFAAVALLTLALGIGANTAIFSVVQTVLLKPLPLRDADRLMTFWITAPAKQMNEINITPGLFAMMRDRAQTLEHLSAYETGTATLTGRGEPEQLDAAAVSADYFRALGVEAIQGRAFLPGEDVPGKNDFVILSHELWQRRFAGSSIIGQSINLDNVPAVVVGIMPPATEFPNRAEAANFPKHIDLWVPNPINRENLTYFNYAVVGRLRPGLRREDAQREMQQLWEEFSRDHDPQLAAGALGAGSAIVMAPLKERIIGNVRTPLLVLLTGVGLVLLIACANIANLLLARAAARNREMALRRCLGASSLRIVRQLLTESLLLAVIGGGLGLLLAAWGVVLLRSLLANEMPLIEVVRVDPGVLLFGVTISLFTGVLFGLAPALKSARLNLQEAIKEGARGSASKSSRRLNDAFVISQIALSLVLLVGALLLVRSFRNLTAVDPGFSAHNVLSASLTPPQQRYGDDQRVRAFYDELLARAQRLPGVTSAALCQIVPFSGGGGGYPFSVEGYEARPGEPAHVSWRRSITPDYFKTMGIRVLQGRAFENTDRDSTPLVAIVDEKLARRYWPSADPLGRRIKIGGATSSAPWLTVVGVVSSVKNRQLDEDARYYIYQPFSQWVRRENSIVLRSTGDPSTLVAGLRSQVAALDSDLPLFDVTTIDDSVARSVTSKKLSSMLLLSFAVTALLLAVIGIYGVISLSVNHRTNEFGIRLALGAQPRNVLQLVLSQGLRVAVIGLAIGVVAAFMLTRLMRSLLFGVSATDPFTFVGVALLLALAALAAAYLPARRATKVDPLIALRYE
jgi:putative ABC transport system permease protein